MSIDSEISKVSLAKDNKMEWRETRSCLLVFIHGFMGDSNSFQEYPSHLQTFLQSQNLKVDQLVYPTYATSASNQVQVQRLMDWLILHASTARYDKVVLLAHSMGGILAADAYRYLYGLGGEGDDTWLNSIYSFFPYPRHPNAHDPAKMRMLVNIQMIITFDTPFYGINSKKLVGSGVQKGVGCVMNLVTEYPSIAQRLIPNSINLPTPLSGIFFPVSIKWIRDSILGTKETPKYFKDSTGKPDDKYNSRSVSKNLSSGIISSIITPGLCDVADKALFLHPLICSTYHQSHQRVKILVEEHGSSRLYFQGYYNSSSLDQGANFCTGHPVEFKDRFTALISPLTDEIDAHMNMFSQSILGDIYYSEKIECIGISIIEGFNHVQID